MKSDDSQGALQTMLNRTRSTAASAATNTRSLAFWQMLLFSLLATAPGLRAVEVLTVRELVSHCQLMEAEPQGVDAQYCIRYIQGFIDGAVVTDVRVLLNAETAPNRSESFSERAKRTRAPSLTDQFRAARLAGFCLGDPLPLQDVVDVVVLDLVALNIDDTAESPARGAVYASLREHFACQDE